MARMGAVIRKLLLIRRKRYNYVQQCDYIYSGREFLGDKSRFQTYELIRGVLTSVQHESLSLNRG